MSVYKHVYAQCVVLSPRAFHFQSTHSNADAVRTPNRGVGTFLRPLQTPQHPNDQTSVAHHAFGKPKNCMGQTWRHLCRACSRAVLGHYRLHRVAALRGHSKCHQHQAHRRPLEYSRPARGGLHLCTICMRSHLFPLGPFRYTRSIDLLSAGWIQPRLGGHAHPAPAT